MLVPGGSPVELDMPVELDGVPVEVFDEDAVVSPESSSLSLTGHVGQPQTAVMSRSSDGRAFRVVDFIGVTW